MHEAITVSREQQCIWAVATLLQAILCVVLIRQRIWKQFPAFVCYISYELFQSALTFSVFTRTINRLYELLYWRTVLIEDCLIGLVIVELIRHFFRIDKKWIPGLGVYILVLTTTVVCLSAFLAMKVSSPQTAVDDSDTLRFSIFASLVICGHLAGISWLASFLVRRMHTDAWAIWVGFVASIGSAMMQTINSVLYGWHHGDHRIDQLVNYVALLVLGFWITHFRVRKDLVPQDA